MIRLYSIIAISTIAISSASFAATDFPGNLVPSDVAKEFASGNILSGLPANFPVPTLPAGTSLYLLGSVDNFYIQRVLLGTTLASGKIKELLKAGYAAGGWVDLSRSPYLLELCHDVLGTLRFQMTTAAGSENRIMGNRSRRISLVEPAGTCAEQFSHLNGGPASSPFAIFHEAVPLLDMPPTSTNPTPEFPIGVFSSSGPEETYYHSESDFAVNIAYYSLAELQAFLAGQMTENGWSRDGDFVGDKSASAVWFKTVVVPARAPVGVPASIATEMVLTARLTSISLMEDSYTVSLIVSVGNPQQSPIGIRGI